MLMQFKDRYFELYGKDGAPKGLSNIKGNKKLAKLMAEYTSDEDEDPDAQSQSATPTIDSSKPWLHEFNQYLNGTDEVPNGMSLPSWWGVRHYL